MRVSRESCRACDRAHLEHNNKTSLDTVTMTLEEGVASILSYHTNNTVELPTQKQGEHMILFQSRHNITTLMCHSIQWPAIPAISNARNTAILFLFSPAPRVLGRGLARVLSFCAKTKRDMQPIYYHFIVLCNGDNSAASAELLHEAAHHNKIYEAWRKLGTCPRSLLSSERASSDGRSTTLTLETNLNVRQMQSGYFVIVHLH